MIAGVQEDVHEDVWWDRDISVRWWARTESVLLAHDLLDGWNRVCYVVADALLRLLQTQKLELVGVSWEVQFSSLKGKSSYLHVVHRLWLHHEIIPSAFMKFVVLLLQLVEYIFLACHVGDVDVLHPDQARSRFRTQKQILFRPSREKRCRVVHSLSGY